MKKLLLNIRSFFHLLPNIIKALLTESDTIDYPSQPIHVPEMFRGSVKIHADNCVGCSMCVLDCPANALEIEKKTKEQFRLMYHRDRCTFCGQCEISCKFDAIYLENTYQPASTDRKNFFEILVNRIDEE